MKKAGGPKSPGPLLALAAQDLPIRPLEQTEEVLNGEGFAQDTVTVPFIAACFSQWYGNVPATA